MSKIEIDAILEEDRKRLLDAACLLGSFVAQAAVFGTLRLLTGPQSATPVMPSVLSVGQVAKLVGKSRQTIRNWIERGEIQAEQRPDGVFRIRKEELQRYLNER